MQVQASARLLDVGSARRNFQERSHLDTASGVAEPEFTSMAVGVVGFAVAQAEEEHADQLARDVADGDLSGNPAFSEPLVVGAEGPRLAVGLDQAHHPEPDLASSQAVALLAEAMTIDTGARLHRFGVPAEMLAELAVASEGVHVAD